MLCQGLGEAESHLPTFPPLPGMETTAAPLVAMEVGEEGRSALRSSQTLLAQPREMFGSLANSGDSSRRGPERIPDSLQGSVRERRRRKSSLLRLVTAECELITLDDWRHSEPLHCPLHLSPTPNRSRFPRNSRTLISCLFFQEFSWSLLPASWLLYSSSGLTEFVQDLLCAGTRIAKRHKAQSQILRWWESEK